MREETCGAVLTPKMASEVTETKPSIVRHRMPGYPRNKSLSRTRFEMFRKPATLVSWQEFLRHFPSKM